MHSTRPTTYKRWAPALKLALMLYGYARPVFGAANAIDPVVDGPSTVSEQRAHARAAARHAARAAAQGAERGSAGADLAPACLPPAQVPVLGPLIDWFVLWMCE